MCENLFLLDKAPFSVPNIHILACTYDDLVDLSHPSFSRISIPPSLSSAIDKRKVEYVVGRFCAQEALKKMGIDGQVERLQDRSPQWPKTVVGSITHTKNFSMAAVGSEELWKGIGIDSETLSRDTPIEICAKQFITPNELALRGSIAQEHWMYTVFSAKESVFKALYPLVKRYFGFFDVEVTAMQHLDSRKGSLVIRLTTALGPFDPGFALHCSFLLTDEHVHTLVLSYTPST